jgi:hypothetical protein
MIFAGEGLSFFLLCFISQSTFRDEACRRICFL